MTADKDGVEAVARAIYLAMHGDRGGRWECVDERYQEQIWGSYARAAIAAMPRPTPAQEQGNSELIAALEPFQDLFRDFTGKVDGAWFDRFAKACIGARFAINNAKPSTPTEGAQ